MFRKHLLIWLFLAATVAVDGVLLATSDSPSPSPLKLGMVLGQLAAVAIWAVRGRLHRLARASCLVFATWGLAGLLHSFEKFSTFSVWFTFVAGYAATIASVTAVADSLSARLPRKPEGSEQKKRWQISLIECFGWTIVASIVSFGARSMGFQFLMHAGAAWTAVAYLAVPVVVALLIRNDLREAKKIRAAGIVLVAIAAASYLAHLKRGGEFVVGFQTAYLILWLAILGMEEVVANARKMR